ncbi:unnamed protein product [Macrosiphum euphorbiae]|uniref:Transposase n=1 Tax=Macrosiphum euphorbiae TaxID=13131 RepID=A0AAV0WLB0_9HEMI|nr:unnamed protein product [Macrosiphum euphorbiae]
MYYFIANSVARSFIGSYNSTASTSSTSSSCQTTQGLSSRTPRKDKLRKMLSHQKHKYNELQQKFNIYKKNYANNQKTMASLEHFQLMCDKFLDKGFSNFVKVQFKLSLNQSKGRRYFYETKQFALMIHFLGPKVYRFLQKSMNLPSPRTLKRTTENWEINPGCNQFLFTVLAKVKSMEPKYKQCVLCVDEMSLKSSLYYDIKKDEIVGFTNRVHKQSYFIEWLII